MTIFSIFGHFDAWGPPQYGQALTEGGFGEHFYGPQAVPWTQPQPRKNSQFNQKPNSFSVISTT